VPVDEILGGLQGRRRQLVIVGVNVFKIGRFENYDVFFRKPMVDERARQSEEGAARVIQPRWDFAAFAQMRSNG